MQLRVEQQAASQAAKEEAGILALSKQDRLGQECELLSIIIGKIPTDQKEQVLEYCRVTGKSQSSFYRVLRRLKSFAGK